MKQKIKQSNLKRYLIGLSALLLVVGGVVGGIPRVRATVQDQINQLEAENAQLDKKVEKLEDQAVSYEDAIDKLAAKIDQLQGKINAGVKEQERLKQEIAKAQAELEVQKDLLGQSVRAMYVEGEISTLEMLASSKDLSEFVDKQQYRNAVQSKITETLEKIRKLKIELNTKKDAVDSLLTDQREQQSELSQARSEQNSLLSLNESQRADYNQKTQANQQKIEELIASQRAANFNPGGTYAFLRFPGGDGAFNPNSYPYKNAGFSMQLGPCSDNDSWPDTLDRWGYCTRQCVSYAAWAVEASGRNAPMYYGSANNWINAAKSHGIPVYSTPRPGDVAISTSGYWGHAMYVESVSGNTFTTSEYNTSLDGRLAYRTRTF